MIFQFNGKKFGLEFSRAKRTVVVYKKGKDTLVESKYPYTTVEVQELQADGTWKIFATASVGCNPKFDIFHPRDGRIWALRKVTKDIPVGMRQVMWECYHEAVKPKEPKKGTPPTGSPSTPITPLLALDIETPGFSCMVH